jgi:hypothetical protein
MDVLQRAGERMALRVLAALAVGACLLSIGTTSGLGATTVRRAPSSGPRRHLAGRKPKPKPRCKVVRRRRGKKWTRVTVCRKPAKRPGRGHAKQTRATGPKHTTSLHAPGTGAATAPTTSSHPSAPTQPSAPDQPAGASAWDEPALVDPTVVTLSASDRSLTLNQSQDYIVECPSGQFDVPDKITIWGGHNVVFQHCDENVTNPAGDWAAYLEDQTGTLWIHDVHFGGVHLTGGVQMQEPGATVVMRDVLFDTVYGSYTTNHAECVQTWSGPSRFMIDGLECPTTYQGLFLLPNQSDSTTLETTWDLRNVQLDGEGAYDLWLGDVQPSQVGVLPVFNVANVYDCGPGEPRDWDGTSDADHAWANVKSCPPGGVAAPVWSNADGSVTGADDGVSPAAITGEQS